MSADILEAFGPLVTEQVFSAIDEEEAASREDGYGGAHEVARHRQMLASRQYEPGTRSLNTMHHARIPSDRTASSTRCRRTLVGTAPRRRSGNDGCEGLRRRNERPRLPSSPRHVPQPVWPSRYRPPLGAGGNENASTGANRSASHSRSSYAHPISALLNLPILGK